MGLGILGGGVGLVTFLIKHGACVLVTDIKKPEELESSLAKLRPYKRIVYILGEHRMQDFEKKDLIIKNPAIPADSPYLIHAKRNKIAIEDDASLFVKLSPAGIIGVTGSKGKSTTAHLIYHFLKGKYPCFLAGIVDSSPFNFFDALTPHHLVILELSSFELESFREHKISPHGAVVTNIYEDHLNRHKSLKEYIDVKKSIFLFQKTEDFLVLNGDDPIVRNFASEAKGNVSFFSLSDMKELASLIPLNEIFLQGKHNYANIFAALRVAAMYDIDPMAIKNVLREFSGVPSRQQFIGERKRVRFYNDTTATIPDATIAALKSIQGPMILISGGLDKHVSYKKLVREIKEQQVKTVIILPGDASEKIFQNLQEIDYDEGNIIRVNTMEEAVKMAYNKARPGDAIVLSPAAASFNLFRNEFDRGEQFNREVMKL